MKMLHSYCAAALSVMLLSATTQAVETVSTSPAAVRFNTADLNAVAVYEAPMVDLADAAAEDEQREMLGLAPRFAEANAVQLTTANSGTWEPINDKQWLWRLHVESPGATSLNFGFSQFHLPASAELRMYDTDMTNVTRAITAADNKPHGEFWSPVIPGGDGVIELLVDTADLANLQLELTSINVGYRGFFADKGLRAGSCNIDVVCSWGDNWREEIPSVGVISTGGSTFCTGFMVNNTAEDEAPLFMTANHCGISTSNDQSLVVYWNFESPVCGQQSGGSLGQWQSGSTHLQSGSASDFTIVELDSVPNPDFGVTYAGWDATGVDTPLAVAIHHPNTDEKSISFENQPTTTTTYLSNSVPGNGTHVRVEDWDRGTTEPGSSGSPLFDQNHRVIGQLHGGYAACGNNDSDWYGRISVSWAAGLSNYLDPIGSGQTTIDTLVPGQGGLSVSGNDLAAVGDPGGPFAPTSTIYTLENAGDYDIAYAIYSDVDWLDIDAPAGSLPIGASVNVTVSLNYRSEAMSLGEHTATLNFVNTVDGEGDETHNATLTIGGAKPVYLFPLDTDPGWTTTAQWAFGQPSGQGGDHGNADPTSGYTGSNVYGYNLSGDYVNNMPEYSLTTTAIDCSTLQGVELKFQRWLNVERNTYDHAYIRVSNNGTDWTTVWANADSHIQDDAWVQVSYDISDVADYQSTVYIRWTQGSTDSSWTFSGWNIDDVEIWGITPAPGDWDGDGDIDAEDLMHMSECITGPDAGPATSGCDIFDYDKDGDVDMYDFQRCAVFMAK